MTATERDADTTERLQSALARHQAGALAEAKALYEAVLLDDPGQPVALHFLGVLLHQSGDRDGAVGLIRQALAQRPDYPEAHNNLATVLLDIGRPEEAARHLGQAIELAPDFADARRNLAVLLHRQGRIEDALGQHCRFMALRPEDDGARRDLAVMLRGVRLSAPPAALYDDLLRCFGLIGVNTQDLVTTSLALLLEHPGAGPLLTAASAGSDEALAAAVGEAEGAGFLTDPLLLEVLAKALVTDRRVEPLLTRLRRLILLSDAGHAPDLDIDLGFLVALALQCFNTEFVYAVEAEEEACLEAILACLEAPAGTPPDPEIELALLLTSLYRPLYELPAARRRPFQVWSPPLAPLVERTLLEPLEEELVKEEIATLGLSGDATSAAVMAQYEASPYPRWFSIDVPQRRTLGAVLAERFGHIGPQTHLDRPIDALIAGCGTGKQVVDLVLAYETASVLAVDLSRTSLAYAIRMARRYGFDGVDFRQADILALDGHPQTFDMILCSGVLHHMERLPEGLAVLAGLLRPGGVMRIGLYSARARGAVVQARDSIAAQGLGSTPADIRAFRRQVLGGQAGEALLPLAESADFYSLSACRDLLFHVCEHRTTPLEIGQMLDHLGLAFIGFEVPAAAAYRARHPEDPTMTDLALWDRFETAFPDTFGGMLEFWCRAPDTAPV
jgi:SAM-dependent methyltransferase/Tfp pilus assembly protein PilF